MIIKRISGRNNINLIEITCEKCGSKETFRWLKGWRFEKVDVINNKSEKIEKSEIKNESKRKFFFTI